MIPVIEMLNSSHNRKEFSCGIDILDNYLQKQVNQDIKRKLSVCFVLIDQETELIQGYYTLSNNSISQQNIPNKFQNKLPKAYKDIPTTLLGRLAIDHRYQGKGNGKLLFLDALKRSYETSKIMGSFAVVVDPIDENAEIFYSRYGFIKLPESGKMFMPMKIVKQLFE